jgi:hypothetical protein
MQQLTALEIPDKKGISIVNERRRVGGVSKGKLLVLRAKCTQMRSMWVVAPATSLYRLRFAFECKLDWLAKHLHTGCHCLRSVAKLRRKLHL